MSFARKLLAGIAICAAITVASANAGSPQQLLERYAQDALAEDARFDGFSAHRGREFYHAAHPVPVIGEISCASCHLLDPRRSILRHRTKIPCRACHVIDETEHPNPTEAKKRIIEAFAPVSNARRFTDYAKVEKWFKLNCRYLLKRDCSAREKGDLIAWLLTFEPSAHDNKPAVGKEYEWLSSE